MASNSNEDLQAVANHNQLGEMMPTSMGNVKVKVDAEYTPDPIQQPGTISVPQHTVYNMARSDPRVEAILGEARYTEKVEKKTAPAMQAQMEELQSKLNVLMGFIAQGMTTAAPMVATPTVTEPATVSVDPKAKVKAELEGLNYQEVCKRARSLDIPVARGASKADVITSIVAKV